MRLNTLREASAVGGPMRCCFARMLAVHEHGPQEWDEGDDNQESCPMCGCSSGNVHEHLGRRFHRTCVELFSQELEEFEILTRTPLKKKQ